MLTLELKRICQTQEVTTGVLCISSTPLVLTLERPWKDNQPNVSCIPEGKYICKRVHSPHFGETFEVMDVVDRTHILFHKGNYVEDSKGCIILGSTFEVRKGVSFVATSKMAFDRFMELLKTETEFYLIIKGCV